MVRLCSPAVAFAVLAGCNHVPDSEPLTWHHGGDGTCVEWYESRDKLLRHDPRDSIVGRGEFLVGGVLHVVSAFSNRHGALPDTGYQISIELDSIGAFYQCWPTSGDTKWWISNNDSVNGLTDAAWKASLAEDFMFYDNIRYQLLYHQKSQQAVTREGWDLSQVDEQPVFPGGHDSLLAFIRKEIHYPDSEWTAGIEGKLIVLFSIDTDGSVTDVEVRRPITRSMDAEAARAVRSMPRWKPARLMDKPVKCRLALPVIFKLEEKRQQ